MRISRVHILALIIVLLLIPSCKKNPPGNSDPDYYLTIFFVNDQHGQINNFAKIKYMIDQEERTNDVIVASAGDIFSGNPVVDYFPDKGYPIVDLMNKTGFDVSVLGNHEFDYGQEILQQRIDQAQFDWICANVDMSGTSLEQTPAYTTISTSEIKVTFLGLVETSGSPELLIPSTHPLKLEGLIFYDAFDIIDNYVSLKENEGSDLLIALSHMGTWSDYSIARNYPFFDLIIGGHSHAYVDTVINNIPVFQARSYLNYLGKIELEFKEKELVASEYELINLNQFASYDTEIGILIDEYNNRPDLWESIGTNETYLSRNNKLGCFYTDILRAGLGTDVSFQNPGGLRNDLNVGDITRFEIFSMDPFNNGTKIYNMTVSEIKDLLYNSGAGFYYSGILIEKSDYGEIIIKNENLQPLNNEVILSVGINDYIPAVYPSLFPQSFTSGTLTTAETIIHYLETNNSPINYESCSHYFRY